MNIANLMDELGAALEAIPDLRVFPFSVDKINPPAAIVGWPDPLTYDSTMARGSDQLTLPVFVLVGRFVARSARDTLAAYLDGSGAGSIKAVLDGGAYTACDSVRVATAEVQAITAGGVEYLGAVFDVEIFGPGS